MSNASLQTNSQKDVNEIEMVDAHIPMSRATGSQLTSHINIDKKVKSTIDASVEEEDDDDEGDEIDDDSDDDRDPNDSSNPRERYKQRYLPAWELDVRLRDWLAPCPKDEFSAYCKICHCNLHAHKKGLVVHANSNKHKRQRDNPNLNQDVVPYQDINSNDLTRSNDVTTPNIENLDETGDEEYLRRMRKRKLRQELNVFSDKWLFDPLFSSWIRRIPHDRSKALCIACRCAITAGRSELKKHTRSKKHRKAMVEGPFDELDEFQIMRLHPHVGGQDTSSPSINLSKSVNSCPDVSSLKIPSVSYNQRHITTMRQSSGSSLPGIMLSVVLDRLEEHVPLVLAEKWDNVGVISRPTVETNVNQILLTNDLNEKIVQEAINKKVQLIISYHPPIFAPIKRLSLKHWKDKAILMCIENKITLYSPHTALDAIKGGINDWLISAFITSSEDTTRPICHSLETKYNSCLEVLVSGENQDEIKHEFNSMNNVTMTEYGNSTNICAPCTKESLLDIVERLARHSRETNPIYSKVLQLASPPLPGVGMGRIANLVSPLPLYEVVQRTKSHLDLPQVRLALSPKHTRDTRVKTIAVCAGSGASVLKGCVADIWVTGEMSHHEVLDATHNGVSVILCDHSNTERGFFREWAQQLKTSIFEEKVEVIVSEFDRDPLKII